MRNLTIALSTLLTTACPGNGDGPTTGNDPGTTTSTTAGSEPGTTTAATTGTTDTTGTTTTAGSTSGSSSGSDTTDATSTGETTDTTGPVNTTNASESSGETTASDTTGGETLFEGDAADGEVCGLIIQSCVYQCYQLKWPCIDACIAEGSPNGAAEAQAVVDCAYIDCGYDTNCYTSFCLDEWYACTEGPLTCEQEVVCIQHCADDDTQCKARCYYESTADAQKQYDNLEFCRMNNGCAELDDQCMKEFCTWNYMACLGWP